MSARVTAVFVGVLTTLVAAQRGGGGGRGGAPIPFDSFTGFEKIFDGTTLTNWDGDPTFWRAEAGTVVGESTAEKPVTENTFLIYRGSEPDNFELKIEFRMNSTNSGVQYRSRQLTGAVGKWVLCGYQADIDFNNAYTGPVQQRSAGRAARAGRRTGCWAACPDAACAGTATAAARSDWTGRGRRGAARHHQGQRLESAAHHRARHHADSCAQRARDGGVRGRRSGESIDERAARRPDPHRTTDEDRVQKYLSQEHQMSVGLVLDATCWVLRAGC
jgi:hypothetical protein